ncbi:MAG: chitobiase/beta-hexosaminidase C-terminal domain-containing protein, partial [Alloprevotella sp.]
SVKGSNKAAEAVWANSTPLTAKGITLSGDKGSNTVCSYYDGDVVRFYAGNNLIITPKAGITIEKIEIVRSTSTSNNDGPINCSGLTASSANAQTNTNVYTGSATGIVTFTAAKQARFTEIKVYYTGVATGYVEAPTLTIPEGVYFEAQTVKVNNYDSDLKYYYTTDAEEPTWDASFQPTGTTKAYNDETGINISENTTLKILATDGSNSSSVVTAVYTITTPDASSIMALRQLVPGTYNVSLTDAIVTYVNGKNAYIQDATGGLFINTSHSLKAGDKVSGRVAVELVDYFGTDKATTFDVSGATITSDNDIPVTTLTIADLLTGDGMKTYESMRVKIDNAIVTAAITDRTGTIVEGGNEITIYEGVTNCLKTTCMTDVNAIANVIGYPTTYNTAKQLKLWNASAVEETGYNLSVSAAGYATYFNSSKAYTLPASCVGYVWLEGNIEEFYNESENVVPANEPLVIQAAAGSYPLMFTTTSNPSCKSVGLNALEGTDEATAITPDENYYFYGLSLNSSNDINSVGFYWMVADGAAFTNGAHKAYLKIEKSEFASTQPVRGFAFKGTTTGVESVESSNNAPQAIYDLTGRRVSKAEKGIYIINGKKVIK